MSKPYPHYCQTHAVYYGSPTDTIPATMCPLCGIAKELRAQPAPRTYEVARALSWVDAVENSASGAIPSNIERLEKVNEALVEACQRALAGFALLIAADDLTDDERDQVALLRAALSLAKEPA